MPSNRSSRSCQEKLRRLANHVAARRQFPHQLSLSLVLALLLFALWIVLSGRLDGAHLVAGAATAVVISVADELIGFVHAVSRAQALWLLGLVPAPAILPA